MAEEKAALAAGTGVVAWRQRVEPESHEEPSVAAAPDPAQREKDVVRALALDEFELEIGYGLTPLVDTDRGGELLGRIRAMRSQLALDLGFAAPRIHIRDDLQLEPDAYAVHVRGNPVATSHAPVGRWLAIQPDGGAPKIPGIATRDPAFGLPAQWIQERDRERAAGLGYAVVDAGTAVATHLAELIRAHAPDLLSRQHVEQLLDEYAARAPSVVDDIVPGIVPVALLHRTLRALLAERVSIRDIGGILETLAEHAPRVQAPDLLTDLVRERLGRTVTRPYIAGDGSLNVITLAPELEERLRSGVDRRSSGRGDRRGGPGGATDRRVRRRAPGRPDLRGPAPQPTGRV